MKSWSVNSKEGCLLTATGQEAWSEGWQRKPSSVATTFSTEDVSAIVKDRIALRGKSMLENCAVMKRRIVCEKSTTTLVGVMGLHRNSSIWPEMGKAGVQGSSSPKRCLEKDPKNCSTVRGPGMEGWLPVVEKLGIHPSVRATEQHQLRQEDSCYFKHLGLVSSVTTLCRRTEITAQSNEPVSNKHAYTVLCSHRHLVLHGSLWRSLPAVAPGAPKPPQIACSCNQNAIRDYTSGWNYGTRVIYTACTATFGVNTVRTRPLQVQEVLADISLKTKL